MNLDMHGEDREVVRKAKVESLSENISQPIFIGGIPLETTMEQMYEYLEKFDEVVLLQMPVDKETNRIKGYAKAILKTEEGTQRIVNYKPHKIHGLEFGISSWVDKDNYLKKKDRICSRKAFIKFHYKLKADDIRNYMSGFGEIENLELKVDHYTKKPRYFGYVTYVDQKSAEAAVFQTNHIINGRWLTTESSKPTHLAKKAEESQEYYGSDNTESPTNLHTTEEEPMESFTPQIIDDQLFYSQFPKVFNPETGLFYTVIPKEQYFMHQLMTFKKHLDQQTNPEEKLPGSDPLDKVSSKRDKKKKLKSKKKSADILDSVERIPELACQMGQLQELNVYDLDVEEHNVKPTSKLYDRSNFLLARHTDPNNVVMKVKIAGLEEAVNQEEVEEEEKILTCN